MFVNEVGLTVHALVEDWLREHCPDRFGFTLVLHDIDESATGIYTNLSPTVACELVIGAAEHMTACDAVVTENPMCKQEH